MNAGYSYEPPEAQSIKSMYHIVRILAIVFGILLILGGLAGVAFLSLISNACRAATNCTVNSGGLGFVTLLGLFVLLLGVIDLVIYLKMKNLEALVDARQYEQAKHETLIWMILGFILGGLIPGVLLLIAYIKFDPLIASARAGSPQITRWGAPGQIGQAPQGQWGAPAPATWGQATAPAAVGRTCTSCGTPNAAGSQFCAKCGAALPP